MPKAENVIDYYILCNTLKNLIRSGWKIWNVEAERLESVAEHSHSAQMLALAMHSEYNYDVDLNKVIMMLTFHELEEAKIGDLVFHQITEKAKQKKGHKAVDEILSILSSTLTREKVKNLILEFDEKKTKEAIFAFYCDKLEADLQAKVYGDNGLVDITDQEENALMDNETVKRLLDEGNSFSEMWLKFSQERYNYDENFIDVSNYALTHKYKKFN